MVHWCLKCDQCGTMIESETPMRCGHCNMCLYCSTKCQRTHIGKHRADCYMWRVHIQNCKLEQDLLQEEGLGVVARVEQDLAAAQQRPPSGLSGCGPRREEEEEDEEKCPICLELVAGRVEVPGCKHVFCYRCLREWQQRNPSCPTCRGGLPADAASILMDEASLLSIRANKSRDSEERVLGLTAAKGKVEEALGLDPLHNHARPWRLFLGETMSSLGEHAEALALVRQHFDDTTTGSGLPYSASELARLRFRDLCFMAQCQMRLDDHQAAIALLLQCLSEDELSQVANAPQHAKECRLMWADLAEAFYHSAQDDLQRGDRAAAGDKLQRCLHASEAAVEMNRNYPGVWKYPALAHEALGNVDEAIKTLIKVDP